jgi:hypothetical protein
MARFCPAVPFTPAALPQELPEVFSLLSQHGVRNAIVYGGCLRDAHFGKPVRDFDILIPCNTYFGNTVKKLLHKFRESADHTERVNGSDYHFNFTYGTLELDVFFCPPEMEKHPTAAWKASKGLVGLSCIALDQATRQVWVDPQFLRDAAEHKITFRDFVPENAPTDPYVEKIRLKYPDHQPFYPFKLHSRPH